MIRTMSSTESTTELSSERERYLIAFRWMLLGRLLDEKFASLYRAGKIHGGVFLGRGQEALSVSLAIGLKKGDVYAPLIRDQSGRLVFGETILDAVRTYMGSPLGPMRAREGNVHRGKPKEGYLAMISHLGAMIAVVNGALLAKRLKGIQGAVGAACIGEGATSTGAVHEALNQASVEKLPLVLVVANNQYAYSTPNSRQFACQGLEDRAKGYGITGVAFEAVDLRTCLQVVGDAVCRAREGAGPQLLVANLLRLCGHGEHDDAAYIDPILKSSPLGRDCVKVAEKFLLTEQWATPKELRHWRDEAIAKIEEAVATVQREPGPDPYKEHWCPLASKHLMETYGGMIHEA
jgi:acetoin:2,6-dichlorophenolindophenol oxidoreductase subunit alpha